MLWVDEDLTDFRPGSLHVCPSWRASEPSEVQLVLTHAKAATRVARIQSHIVEKEIAEVALLRDDRRPRIERSDHSLYTAVAYKRRRAVTIEVNIDRVFL